MIAQDDHAQQRQRSDAGCRADGRQPPPAAYRPSLPHDDVEVEGAQLVVGATLERRAEGFKIGHGFLLAIAGVSAPLTRNFARAREAVLFTVPIDTFSSPATSVSGRSKK
jgi:hypothetical protein